MIVNPQDAVRAGLTALMLPTGEELPLAAMLGLAGLGAVTPQPAASLPPSPNMVRAIADAIDRQEGPGAVNNNPGNLRSWGNLPTRNGFAVFPTLAEGRAALERQVELNISRGLTLEEFFRGKPGVYSGYAPAADRNNPAGYAANVAQWTGIPLGVPLNQIGSVPQGPQPGDVIDFVPLEDSFGFSTESAPTLAFNGAVILILLGAAVAVANRK